MVIQPRAADTSGTSMRRPLLLTLIALGSLVCLIGSTGLFAALTDTARTGTNSVDSEALASSADIQLATATYDSASGAITCGETFADNLLTTPFITASNVDPGWFSPNAGAYFCIANAGSQAVSLSAMADELTDLDTDCTGDEALYDTTTCGGGLAGELSFNLRVASGVVDCSTGGFTGGEGWLNASATTPAALGSLASGSTGCYAIQVYYPTEGSNPWNVTAEQIQRAQSDTVTWRFMFIADAPTP